MAEVAIEAGAPVAVSGSKPITPGPRKQHQEKTRMRLLKPIATTALSFAFLTAGALAQNQTQQNSQSTTQSTTSTDAYGQTQTQTQHKAKKTEQTTLPDGTTVTTQQKTDATHYDANGNPVAGQRSTSNSQDTVSPDGQTQTHTETQTNTQSNPTTPPPPPPTTPR
jgi:hypothetical protein